MYEELYANAVAEAKRFLAVAQKLEDECDLCGEIGSFGFWRTSKQTAAVRRASMDLTRALADLRRGR